MLLWLRWKLNGRRASLRFLSRFHILETGSEEDVILLLCVMILVPLAPVVGNSVSEYLSVLVKRTLGNGLLTLLRGFQLGPRVLVPEWESSVWTYSRQGSVNRMERNIVHRKYILRLIMTIIIIIIRIDPKEYIQSTDFIPNSSENSVIKNTY